MQVQNRAACFGFGERDLNFEREASTPQQRRVQQLRPVGRPDQEDPAVSLEVVHLVQKLVDDLVRWLGDTAHAVGNQRIDLVEKDDRRRDGPSLLKEPRDRFLALADPHREYLGGAGGVEAALSLRGEDARDSGLAGAGRPVEQQSRRGLDPELAGLCGVFEHQLDLSSLATTRHWSHAAQ